MRRAASRCNMHNIKTTSRCSAEHQDATSNIKMQLGASRCNVQKMTAPHLARSVVVAHTKCRAARARLNVPHRAACRAGHRGALRCAALRCAALRRACLQRSVPASRARRTGRAQNRTRAGSKNTPKREIYCLMAPTPAACMCIGGRTNRSFPRSLRSGNRPKRESAQVGTGLSGNGPK
jgi:hypothetical protein